jgi:hypothetical protein
MAVNFKRLPSRSSFTSINPVTICIGSNSVYRQGYHEVGESHPRGSISPTQFASNLSKIDLEFWQLTAFHNQHQRPKALGGAQWAKEADLEQKLINSIV